MLVSQILKTKQLHDVVTVLPTCTVSEAARILSEKGIGTVVVSGDGKTADGILSERDYARKVLLKGRSSRNTPVRDIMSREVVCAEPDQNVEHCMNVMTEKRIRHLPVMENGRLIGIVSIGDLVKSIISEQQETIEQLESYIRG